MIYIIKHIFKFIVIIFILTVIYCDTFGNYFFSFWINWGIQLSKNKIAYQTKTEASFNGDRVEYVILDYYFNIKNIKNVSWISEKNQDIENEINKILVRLNVDKKHRVDFKDEYLYFVKEEQDYSKLYMFYMPSQKKMYIIEFIV